MGHCDMEMMEKKGNQYGSKSEPYGKIHSESEYKTSNNNKKTNAKINKNSDYENIKNKVMKK
jgi:hypothetical protein